MSGSQDWSLEDSYHLESKAGVKPKAPTFIEEK